MLGGCVCIDLQETCTVLDLKGEGGGQEHTISVHEEGPDSDAFLGFASEKRVIDKGWVTTDGASVGLQVPVVVE